MADLTVNAGAAVMGPAATTVEWAVAGAPADGQESSGDRHVVSESAEGLLIAVVDAIGHGAEAAAVASTAAESIATAGGRSLVSTIQRCHRVLSGTRGAVLCTARIDSTGALSWLTVGNISATVMRRRFGRLQTSAVALIQAGVVGVRLPPLREANLALQPGDLILISTDGVEVGITRDIGPDSNLSTAISQLVDELRIRSDDSLLLAARYLGSRD